MKRIRSAIGRFIDKHPLFSFGVGLFLLLDVIFIGNFLRKPIVEPEAKVSVAKKVEVFEFGENPSVGVVAVVERSGVVRVVAQSSGIVNSVLVKEGAYVGAGAQLAYVASTYSGESIADLSRQITDKSTANTEANLSNQLEILSLQRRAAEKAAADAGVSGGSVGDLQRESAVRQTDSGATGLRLAAEIGNLNLAIASVSAQLGRPTTPISGYVDRVFVKAGENVNAGMPIALVSQTNGTATVRAFVSADMAKRIDKKKKAKAVVDGKTVELTVRFVAGQPTDGSLYAVTMDLPKTVSVDDEERIFVSLPITMPAGSVGLFVPLDAIYQTQAGAYVFVVKDENGKKTAAARTVELGDVVGSFVTVREGLSASDSAILSRTVVDGDRVEVR